MLAKRIPASQIKFARSLILALTFVYSVCLSSAPISAQTHQESSALSAKANATAGKPVFERYCSPCHGIAGGGGRGPRLNRPRLPHAPDDAALRSLITNGIPPAMPDAWYLTEEEIADVAAHIRSLGKIPAEKVPGDPVRGSTVYVRAGCSTCHILSGKGVGFGPDLTDVGDRRNATYLRQVLRDPPSALPEDFLLVTAITFDGKNIRGIRLNEDTFTIQIKDFSGNIHSLRKQELKDLKKETGQTPMPSFEKILPPTDLQDLVAFLAASRDVQ
jgi:putative heme-binding domain-containing protein